MKYPDLESSTLEFKRELPKNDQIIKTIIGFCNQSGGKLIIGVDDTGDIVGISDEAIQNTLEYLEKSIYDASYPHIIVRVYAQLIGEKTILIIQVSEGMNKPYYVKSEGIEKGTYIRLGRSTVRATPDIIDELQWQSRGRSFDQMPVYQARMSDIDLDEFKYFLTTKKIAVKKINKDALSAALKSYHLAVDEQIQVYPTVAGILLFGKEPQYFFSEAFIICSHFAGISGREVIATRDCMGVLTEQFQNAYDFIMSRLNKSFTIDSLKRKEKLEIPPSAIREVIMNAVIHRNYHIQGPTKIAIYQDRIEIFSPGGFVGPIHTDNLRMGLTYIRNTAIVKVLREMGYIEKLGSGFKTLFDEYERAGLPKPKVIEGENYIKCILPRPTPEHEMTRKLPELDQKILNLFETATQLSIRDVLDQLRIPRSTVGRMLADLVKKGLLKKMGKGKNVRYSRVFIQRTNA